MKLRTRAFVALLIVSIPLNVLIIATQLTTSQDNIINQATAHLSSVASIHKNRVEGIVRIYNERLETITTQGRIPQALSDYVSFPNQSTVDQLVEIIKGYTDLSETFNAIDILSINGSVVASTEVSRIELDLSETNQFLEGRIRTVLDSFYHNDEGVLGVYLSGPIYYETTLFGVCIIDLSALELVELFGDYTGFGDSGESLLAKRDTNGDALFINQLRFDPTASLNRTLSQLETTAPITIALNKVEDVFVDAKDYRNKTVVAVTKYIDIEGVDWGLVVKIDQDEAFTPIYLTVQISGITFILAIAVSIFLSLYIARLFTQPIEKLAQATKQIGEGEGSIEVEATMADELYTLADTINTMATGLITVNIELEKRVEERTTELTRSNEDLERFAYVISHDLQEPLRMISSYLQLINERYKGQLDKDADEFIHFAVDGAQRMREMIIDLLTYSRAGRDVGPIVEVDCNQVLEDVLTNLGMIITESEAQIDIDELPLLLGNRNSITTLFQNLISNAIKFRTEETPVISIRAIELEDEWEFEVQDNGIGIDSKYSERIFEVFQRLHPKSKYSGTGIGLAICKRVVESLRGKIWMESDMGEGSSFHFTVPSAKVISK